jgi:ribosome biogenesis GTPase
MAERDLVVAAHPPLAVPAGLGWDEGWADSFVPFSGGHRRPARVVAAHRGAWVLALDDVDRDAVLAGRLRHGAVRSVDLPAVGDWVAADADATVMGPAVIAAVLPRRSAFRRAAAEGTITSEQVLAANVDVALIVTGLDGDFNLRRLERYVAVAWSGGAIPVIVLNKADTARDPHGAHAAAQAVAPGVDVRVISARSGAGVAELNHDHLGPGRTAVVLGSSGAGKSTLLNALLGESRARTAAVRADDSRGRHTTTHRELHRLPGGGLLIDTPGIRSLGVGGAGEGLAPAFADVVELAAGCRFADCDHQGEPGCAVQAALDDGRLSADRFASHRKLEREAEHAARQTDRLLREEHRRKWKAIGAAAREQMTRKYGTDR